MVAQDVLARLKKARASGRTESLELTEDEEKALDQVWEKIGDKSKEFFDKPLPRRITKPPASE